MRRGGGRGGRQGRWGEGGRDDSKGGRERGGEFMKRRKNDRLERDGEKDGGEGRKEKEER